MYHPDGTDDHGSFKGLGVDFADYVTRRLGERYAATMHTIANTIIEFTGPDTAHVESHVCARQRRADGVVLETFGGRYVDRFERRDGEWRIAHRNLVHEWDKVEHVELAFPPGRYPEGGRSDPQPLRSRRLGQHGAHGVGGPCRRLVAGAAHSSVEHTSSEIGDCTPISVSSRTKATQSNSPSPGGTRLARQSCL